MNPPLLFRYGLSLGLFIIGLILSGVTAFPLLIELRLLASWLGIADPSAYAELTGLQHWIARVLFALEYNRAQFPFLA
ncbi:MAG TPA: hypothetical protein VHN79_00415, partial [Lacunisphaera sp.]|nr:hypothetical protein [Lacunisphaera sp.]